MKKYNEDLAKAIDDLVDFEDLAHDLAKGRGAWANFVASLAGKQLEKHDYDGVLTVLEKLDSKIKPKYIQSYGKAIEALAALLKAMKEDDEPEIAESETPPPPPPIGGGGGTPVGG